jgi:hypothetical protein
MRNGTRKFGLVGAIGLALILVAGCNAEDPTAASAKGVGAGPSFTVGDSSVVVGGAGQEATAAGDTTGRGGVYVGSGH